MECAYKYRIYPNKQQKELISKTFGSCRLELINTKNQKNHLHTTNVQMI